MSERRQTIFGATAAAGQLLTLNYAASAFPVIDAAHGVPAAGVFCVDGMNQIGCECILSGGVATTIEIVVETTLDGITWRRQGQKVVGAGVTVLGDHVYQLNGTVVAGTNGWALDIPVGCWHLWRLRAKYTGGAAATMRIMAHLGAGR